MRLWRALFPIVLILPWCSSIEGQEVVSARSGMVHFTQGQVFLDDRPLDRKSGSFPAIKEGATLRTEKGRAEVLLTPGAFLRLDENSSIRMVSTELADTRLVFLTGSSILDLSDAARTNNSAITITYKDVRAKFPKPGVYRLDADTGVLQVYSGAADVTYQGQNSVVDPAHLFFCWLGLQTDKLGAGTEDEFYDWASDRNQAIADQNQLAADTARDPGDIDPDPSALLGGGGVPYLGSPGTLSPRVGPSVSPLATSPAPYSSYSLSSVPFNPFFGVTPTPFSPLMPPIVVLNRAYRTPHTQWPHSVNRPLWHPVPAGAPHLPAPGGPTRMIVPSPIGALRPGVSHVGGGAVPMSHPHVMAPARPISGGIRR